MTTSIDLEYRLFTRHGRTRRFRQQSFLVLDAADRPRYIGRRKIRITSLRPGAAKAVPASAQRRKVNQPKQTRRPDEEAQAAENAKSAFLSCVSHELRTPLTSILCGLRLVLDGVTESPVQAHEMLQVAYASGQRLAGLINDILEISNLEAGLMKADPQPVTVGPLLDDVSSLMQPIAQRQGLRLEWRVANPAKMVQADPALLRQILLNLVVNAVKFTEAGQVTLSQRLRGGRMELIVADTGIGIAPDLQAALFQPFVQRDNSSTRRQGGTGLGLSLSRRLAELMGGSLTLQSAGEGHGSTFIVSLPLAAGSKIHTQPHKPAENKFDRRSDTVGQHDH